MPRAKAAAKKTDAKSEPLTENGHGTEPAPEEAPKAAKGKGRAKKQAVPEPVVPEIPQEVEPKKAASSRGKKKAPPKDSEENSEPKAASKPRGRAKAASAEPAEPPAAKAAPSKGRKRKEPPADANNAAEELAEPAEPPKRRAKKETAPASTAVEEPAKEKAKKAPRGAKRLADAEIANALMEEEDCEVQPPPKPATKRGKKAAKPDPEPEITEEPEAVEEAPPKAKKRATKKAKESESVEEVEEKPAKQRGKKKAAEEEPAAAPSKKRTKKTPVEKEASEPEKPAAAVKPGKAFPSLNHPNHLAKASLLLPAARSRKKAAPKEEEDEIEQENGEVDGSKSMLAEQSGCGGAAVLKSLQNMLNFCFPASKAAKNGVPAAELDSSAFALPGDKEFNLKICSWNVAGLRAWLKKDGLKLLGLEEPDIFCLQETKCSNEQLPEEVTRIAGYHPYWLCMPGGYAGVAIYSKIMPIHVEYGIKNEEFDDVGRMITAEYEKFYLINVYVPNSGRKLVNLEPRMRWEKLFQQHVQRLDALKPVVICGDMNVSHMPIDLANPKTNTKNAGFTQEERDKMTELLSLGFVDTFRHLYPDRKGAYTFWTYMSNARARDVGWRLDYCIVSERFVPKVVEHVMRKQCLGSDHCPITIFFNI
ncbi:hypothetical protein KR018_004187 [Drosophila ironensis]|nr:hypothetical protein KR018_004187 [Drosophila ironensis]